MPSMNQNSLRTALEATVESCVNLVGVDLNLASAQLLKYVAGLSENTAAHIVDSRNQKGAFFSRKELLQVSGVGSYQLSSLAVRLR